MSSSTPVDPLPATTCPDLHGIDPSVAGLALETRPITGSITQASTGEALLHITNIGSETAYVADVGVPIIGTLVDPGTLHVRGQYSGEVSGVGFEVNLAPGQSTDIHVVFVGALCGGHAGAVPPGAYGLRVALTDEASASRVGYLADEVPITVTEATVSTVDPEHTIITDFISPPSP